MDRDREARGRGPTGPAPRHERSGYGEESSVAERLAVELLEVCLDSAGSYGARRQRVLAALQSAERGTRRASLARRLFHDTHWLGELANCWARDPMYVEEAGHPLPLRVNGPAPSFSALVRRYFQSRKVADILQLALSTGVICRTARGRVALRDPCVMLTGQPELLLARAVLCVRGLLAATANNGRGAALSPDRLACSVVDKGQFESFAALMRPRVYELVETGNRYLSEYAVREQPGEAGGGRSLVGVHAYVFSD